MPNAKDYGKWISDTEAVINFRGRCQVLDNILVDRSRTLQGAPVWSHFSFRHNRSGYKPSPQVIPAKGKGRQNCRKSEKKHLEIGREPACRPELQSE